jgi:hypothetical protein
VIYGQIIDLVALLDFAGKVAYKQYTRIKHHQGYLVKIQFLGYVLFRWTYNCTQMYKIAIMFDQ